MNLNKIASLLIILIAIVIILIFGQQLLIPFVFALLLWFLIREVRHFIDKAEFIKEKIPSWLKNIMTSAVMIFILGLISKVLSNSINDLVKASVAYEANVTLIIDMINTQFDINLFELLKGQAGSFNYGSLLSSIINSLTEILGNAFIIIIYTLFIFLEENNFQTKLQSVFKEGDRFDKVMEILEKIERSISRYVGLKTLISFITGLLSYFALLYVGIDSPIFWAFIIFAFNYIPTIGSLIGTLFPAVFCLLQFGSFTECLIVLGVVGTIQVIVGNLIEPHLMGNSLNISSLTAILSLSFWGAIWGVTGMILSVPITVILVIIFSNFIETRKMAIMLSEKGDI